MTPHLHRYAEPDASEDPRLEQVEVRVGSLSVIEIDRLLDLVVLELNELVADLALAVTAGRVESDLPAPMGPSGSHMSARILRALRKCTVSQVYEVDTGSFLLFLAAVVH